MLAGVLGVIVAAVVFAKSPPPSAESAPSRAAEQNAPPAEPSNAPAPTPTTAPGTAAPNTAALPSTPVARTRKETDGQPTSRSGAVEEEP
jgi:hypothetical protein